MIKVLLISCLAWSASWTVQVIPPASPLNQGFNEFEIRIEGAEAAKLDGAQVTLEGNMAHPGMKPTYGRAKLIGPGQFKGRLEFTMAGDWRVQAHIRLKNGERLEQSIDIPGVR